MAIFRIKNKAELKDALDLVWDMFQEFEAPDYTSEGVSTFRDFIAYDSIFRKINSEQMNMWGYYSGAELQGVIGARDINHISLLFVKKEYFRQGIARKLFENYVSYCKEKHNITSITVNSSPYAVEVYHHLGFEDIEPEKITSGIRHTPMKYENS